MLALCITGSPPPYKCWCYGHHLLLGNCQQKRDYQLATRSAKKYLEIPTGRPPNQEASQQDQGGCCCHQHSQLPEPQTAAT
jgi:hypothetical protein